MNAVLSHVRARSALLAERAIKPVVAWDCMGAETWSKAVAQFADEIEGLGLDEQGAIAWLMAKREELLDRTAGSAKHGGLSMLVGMDCYTQMNMLIDPVAKERRGWIEVSARRDYHHETGLGELARPRYRRMLGTNNCTGYIERGRDETDESWATRRREWLAQYHPQVWVIHDGMAYDDWDGISCHTDGRPFRATYTAILGNVGSFVNDWDMWGLDGAIGSMCSIEAHERNKAA